MKDKKAGDTQWTYFGSFGAGRGQFSQPRGICYDPVTDFMHVADCGNSRIVRTRMDGTGWYILGSIGTGIRQFDLPCNICYDPVTVSIHIADMDNHRIVRYKCRC